MKTIVIGSLNTDLVAKGIKQFPKPGEHVYGKELLIGPGGKSRNIADMLASLAPKGSVAMVGRTVKDPYGLWKQPLDALARAGVNTDFVNVLEYEAVHKLPGIVLIPVDQQGNNQIFVLPGVSDDFSVDDIDAAVDLFKEVADNNGTLVLTLECPIETATYAVQKANKRGLKVMFDPGGIEGDTDINKLLAAGIFLIKPNEHEAKILTGVEVTDYDTAEQAAKKLQERGVANVLITSGANGAYLFSKDTRAHIPIPNVSAGNEKDETGCGDQTMATLCALLQDGKPIKEAAELAILSGTLQFYRTGIQPVTFSELSKFYFHHTESQGIDTLLILLYCVFIMSRNLEFRSYTEADLPELPSLFMRAIRVADPRLEDGPWIDDLRNPDNTYGHGGDIVVGIINDEIVALGGLKRVDEQTVEMKRVGLEPSKHGHGLGKQLLGAIESRAKELGASKIVLDSPHEAAVGMYRNNGYIETGVEEVEHASGHTYQVFFFEKTI